MQNYFLLNPEKKLAQIRLVVFEKNAKTHNLMIIKLYWWLQLLQLEMTLVNVWQHYVILIHLSLKLFSLVLAGNSKSKALLQQQIVAVERI